MRFVLSMIWLGAWASPAHAVDVSRVIHLPRVDGLAVTGEIPAEIDSRNLRGEL